jgi:hypothetical protein
MAFSLLPQVAAASRETSPEISGLRYCADARFQRKTGAHKPPKTPYLRRFNGPL